LIAAQADQQLFSNSLENGDTVGAGEKGQTLIRIYAACMAVFGQLLAESSLLHKTSSLCGPLLAGGKLAGTDGQFTLQAAAQHAASAGCEAAARWNG
jgi:hypothetical protein